MSARGAAGPDGTAGVGEPTGPSGDPALHARMDEAVEALLAHAPTWRSGLGDHSADDRLDDLSENGVAAQLATLDRLTAQFTPEPEPAGVADRVDLAILRDGIAGRRFALAELAEWRWNPLHHLPGEALFGLIARETAPAADRLLALTGRLAAVPEVLANARAVLQDVPAIHRDTAIGQSQGVLALVRDQLEPLLTQEPGLRGSVEAAQRQAISALTEFANWLTALPDGRDPRLGEDLWRRKLAFTLDTDADPDELRAAAENDLAALHTALAREAAEFLGSGPGGDRQTSRAALDRLALDAADDTTILAVAAAALETATAFVSAHVDITIPDDPIAVVAMPEFARGVAVAYCDPPGELDAPGLPTFYAISPTPADWTPARVASFYREYNRHQLANLTVHEAMPGHGLQLAHSRRHSRNAPHRVRAAFRSGTFVEGWAVVSEELMADAGHGGLPVRLQQRKIALRTTINALLDHGVHCAGMTQEQAMELMTRGGFQEEGEAAGKWRRAVLTSTQLSTYYVGWREVRALTRDHLAAGGSYDQLLAQGSPAPRRLRALLGR